MIAGGIYKITPAGEYSVVYTFGGSLENARVPLGGLVLGQNGNLYGTTNTGGEAHNGTIYEFMPAGEFHLIYSFGFDSVSAPAGALIETTPGTFNGTASGGDSNFGVIYKLKLH